MTSRYALAVLLVSSITVLATATNGSTISSSTTVPAPGTQLDPASVFDGATYLIV